MSVADLMVCGGKIRLGISRALMHDVLRLTIGDYKPLSVIDILVGVSTSRLILSVQAVEGLGVEAI